MKRIIVKIATLVSLLFCIAVLWGYFEIWIPNRMIADSSKWDPDNGFRGIMPREKIRNACHKALKYRFGNHHVAFITLTRVGNKDSIPYLIRGLKWLELEYPNAKSSGVVVDTYGNCVGALWQLTGMEVDWDSVTWEKWWKQTGRYLSFNEDKRQLFLPNE